MNWDCSDHKPLVTEVHFRAAVQGQQDRADGQHRVWDRLTFSRTNAVAKALEWPPIIGGHFWLQR